eukprot:gene6981-18517_t
MWKALLYNFLSGTSVIFGAIAIMAADKICQEEVGMLL